MTIAVIYGGTRPNSNTEILTENAVRGLDTEDIFLRELSILPIIDMRHSEEGFQDREDDYNSIIDRVLKHEILIFSTPIYWYSMSGTMKNFVDRWSQTLKDSNYPNFKSTMASKKAYVIAVGGDDPYIKGLPLMQQFKHIFDFMGMEFGGYVIGEGNKPEDIYNDKSALFDAERLRERLR